MRSAALNHENRTHPRHKREAYVAEGGAVNVVVLDCNTEVELDRAVEVKSVVAPDEFKSSYTRHEANLAYFREYAEEL